MNHFEITVLHRNASGLTEIRALEFEHDIVMSAREPIRSGDTIIVRDVERYIVNVQQTEDYLRLTLGEKVRVN